MADWQDLGAVSYLLDECTTWAVVGLSGNQTAGVPMVMDTCPAIEWRRRR